jgi:hypothetical protein
MEGPRDPGCPDWKRALGALRVTGGLYWGMRVSGLCLLEESFQGKRSKPRDTKLRLARGLPCPGFYYRSQIWGINYGSVTDLADEQ